MALSNDIINKLKNSVQNDRFWKFKIAYMIIMDKNYFSISGQENDMMKFTSEITNYVGLQDIVPIHRQKTSVTTIFKKQHVEGCPKTPFYEYQLAAVKNVQEKLRLKLQYGKGVFEGLMTRLMEVINGERFDEWCKFTADVHWEIWSGRDEQSKLKDYRKMKEENAKLLEEIARLKQQIGQNARE